MVTRSGHVAGQMAKNNPSPVEAFYQHHYGDGAVLALRTPLGRILPSLGRDLASIGPYTPNLVSFLFLLLWSSFFTFSFDAETDARPDSKSFMLFVVPPLDCQGVLPYVDLALSLSRDTRSQYGWSGLDAKFKAVEVTTY